MDRDYFAFDGVDESDIRAERSRARGLRRSRWWQQKIALGVCYYCGRTVGIKALTMDHVVPLSRGGKSKKNNLVPCCKACNTRKRASLPLEWEDYIKTMKGQKGSSEKSS